MKPVGPIETTELFPPLSRELLGVLRALAPADWARPTPCPAWTVQDVAAHLLGGSLGRLRSHPSAEPQPAGGPTFDELLALINRANDLWVQAARRISPEILIEFLELTDQRLYEHFRRLAPEEPAQITVAWASDRLPPNWLDIAREYTEKWLHQQHIREAVGWPLLTGREWLAPVVDAFLRGLPRAYRQVEAQPGTSVAVQITGDAGGEWTLIRAEAGWNLYAGADSHAASRVSLPQDLAWRLFTKGIDPEAARPHVRFDGAPALGEPLLALVSIMA